MKSAIEEADLDISVCNIWDRMGKVKSPSEEVKRFYGLANYFQRFPKVNEELCFLARLSRELDL